MPKRLFRITHSLAGRMALAVFGSVALALLVATAASLWLEIDRYALAKRDALTATGEVFASAGARATQEGDARSATETLRAIARRPELVYAAIERPDGSILADQGLTIRLASDLDLDGRVSAIDLLTSRTAQVRVPIVHRGAMIGTLVLVADTTDLFARLMAIIETSAIGSGLALVLGLIVSYALQRSITQPIAALAGTMNRVRADEDYSQTAAIARDDEVGVLAATFNSLLATVRERDERLAKHRDRLERDVADRTADLLEAKDAAEAANTAKSSFLATMSHEIRTPLNGMLVLAELLAGADLPVRQKRHAEVIARSGQSLLAIINDILDFAKVEAGRIDLEQIAVVPGEIVDTVVSLFAEKAREKGLDLAASVSADVPARITGDPVRLGQILSNFVNNALKFTATGSVLVRIGTVQGGLRMSVEDTGIGIPADKLPKIFSAFSQADQSTTRRYGGTGLGLSIAQRLVEAMGGTIGVDSEVGAGSTFWAEIPLSADATAAEPSVAVAEGLPATFVVTAAGAATRTVVIDRLVAAGFAAVAREDGANAHWFADAGDIAALGRRPSVTGRVVAVAGTGDAAASLVLEAGFADEVLRWPVLQDDLTAIVGALARGEPFERIHGLTSQAARTWPRFPLARVLLADDSAVNREVAIEALARFGITEIETAEDGRVAVEKCLAKPFDLILMDGSMPDLDGYEAAKAIRAWEATQADASDARPRVPIVAATAHVIGSVANAWREAGMDGTLSKPFTLQALADVLARHLSQDAAASRIVIAAAASRIAMNAASPIVMDTDPAPAPHDDTSVPLLDAETVEGLADMAQASGGAFAHRVVTIFAEHAPTAILQLRSATADQDGDAAARAAHSLKSMSLNVGGKALALRLATVEDAARAEGTCPSSALIDEIDDLLRRTIDALQSRFVATTAVPPPVSRAAG